MSDYRNCEDGTEYTNSHWYQDTLSDRKPIILVDFDHTITTKCYGCNDGIECNKVQEGCKEALEVLSQHYEIWIYTGNTSLINKDAPCMRDVEDIERFLLDNGIPYDRVLQTKPPAMFIIDDRAVHHKSWLETLTDIRRRIECQKKE
jgi:hypothetical protein